MKLLTEYTSATPLAKPSQDDELRFYRLLVCTTCLFEGLEDQFIDARCYSICHEDAYDCPCCGMTTVVVKMVKIKAISLHEPWASLMRAEKKHNETRSWLTHHRGPLLICAAKKKMTRRIAHTYLGSTIEWYEGPCYGNAVALVNVINCITTDQWLRENEPDDTIIDHPPSSTAKINRFFDEYSRGGYESGRYAWITEPIDTTFEPFPVKGQQGLFTVEVEEGVFAI